MDATWDFQLVYSIWRAGGLSIIPNANLVGNIGNVEDSAHPWRPDVSHYRKVEGLPELVHPQAVVRDRAADEFHSEMLASEYGGREEVLEREIAKRIEAGDLAAARELLEICRAFYGEAHPGFTALQARVDLFS